MAARKASGSSWRCSASRGALDGSWRASVLPSERGRCGEVRARRNFLLAGVPTPELVSERRNSVRDEAPRSHQLGML